MDVNTQAAQKAVTAAGQAGSAVQKAIAGVTPRLFSFFQSQKKDVVANVAEAITTATGKPVTAAGLLTLARGTTPQMQMLTEEMVRAGLQPDVVRAHYPPSVITEAELQSWLGRLDAIASAKVVIADKISEPAVTAQQGNTDRDVAARLIGKAADINLCLRVLGISSAQMLNDFRDALVTLSKDDIATYQLQKSAGI